MKVHTQVVSTEADAARLKTFAESFEHKVHPTRKSIILSDENQQWFGYAQIISTPIFLVGLHPELGRGRNGLEAIKKLQYWSEMQYGESMAAVHPTSPFNELLPRVGFIDMNLKLFKTHG